RLRPRPGPARAPLVRQPLPGLGGPGRRIAAPAPGRSPRQGAACSRTRRSSLPVRDHAVGSAHRDRQRTSASARVEFVTVARQGVASARAPVRRTPRPGLARATEIGCTAVNTRRHGPPRPTRRTFGAAAALMLVGTASACTDDDRLGVEFVEEAPATQVLPGGDPARTALTLSALLVESADGVVIATEDSLEALAAVSASSRLPLLLGTDQAVAEEIDRLGARTLVTAEGTDVSDLGDGLDLIEIDPADADAADSIPDVSVDQQP